MTAHTLARAVCSSTSHHAFEICPPCIEPTLINDISKVCFSKKRVIGSYYEVSNERSSYLEDITVQYIKDIQDIKMINEDFYDFTTNHT